MRKIYIDVNHRSISRSTAFFIDRSSNHLSNYPAQLTVILKQRTMKVAAVTASLLLAGSVSAAVPATLRQKMQARRAESKRHNNIGTKNNWKTGNPLAVGYKDMDDRIVTSNSSSKATYDSNWAGAVTTTTGVTQVQGTWTVPQGNTPPGGDSDSYGAAIWVGIDGDSCQCKPMPELLSLPRIPQ